MKIYLVRHTAVDVAPGTCYGQSDVPLRSTFPEEAAHCAEALKGIRFSRVYTSPLSRCRRLAAFCGYPQAEEDCRLLEIDFGAWELQRYDEIRDPRLQLWYDDWAGTAATGGESFRDQYERVSSFLDSLLERKDSGNVLIFTHGGVAGCALIRAGKATPENVFSHVPSFGGITIIDSEDIRK